MSKYRPSPALVVAVVALVVAMGGTATAARVLITKSSQVKAGSITGSDVRNRSLTGGDLRNGAITASKLRRGAVGAEHLRADARATRNAEPIALEAVRKAGPERQAPDAAVAVATLEVPAGAYAVSAKTIISPDSPTSGLLDALFKQGKSAAAHCVLDAAGDVDDARAPIATPGTQNPATLQLQLTRTVSAPSAFTLRCDANADWRASDTSIVATQVSRVVRSSG